MFFRMITIAHTCIISGIILSFIDKIFWGGSLDFIMINGLFIFDIKDVYISIFEIICIALFFWNIKALHKLNEKELFVDFVFHIRKRYRGILGIESRQ